VMSRSVVAVGEERGGRHFDSSAVVFYKY
jgi:hypothetical protein